MTRRNHGLSQQVQPWNRSAFGVDGQTIDPSIPQDQFSSPGFFGPTPGAAPAPAAPPGGGAHHRTPVVAPSGPGPSDPAPGSGPQGPGPQGPGPQGPGPQGPSAQANTPAQLAAPGGPDLGDPLVAAWAMHSEPNAMYAAVRCWNGLQANSITSKQHDQAKNLINAMWIEASSGDDGNKNAKRFVKFWDQLWAGANGGAYPYGA